MMHTTCTGNNNTVYMNILSCSSMQTTARFSPAAASQSGLSNTNQPNTLPLWGSWSHPDPSVIRILITPQRTAQAPHFQSLSGAATNPHQEAWPRFSNVGQGRSRQPLPHKSWLSSGEDVKFVTLPTLLREIQWEHFYFLWNHKLCVSKTNVWIMLNKLCLQPKAAKHNRVHLPFSDTDKVLVFFVTRVVLHMNHWHCLLRKSIKKVSVI